MEQTLNTPWSARMVKTDGQIVCLRSGSRAANRALDITASPRCALAENSGDLALTLGVMGRDAVQRFLATPARPRELSGRPAPAPPVGAR